MIRNRTSEMVIRPTSDAPVKGSSDYRPPAKEWAEIQPLCNLCAAGKLYAVEKWIDDGNPLQCVPQTDRKLQRLKSPLHIAVSMGFHSLAELLLVNGYDPNGDREDNLSPAVETNNHPMVHLLLRMGADPSAVDFETVLETYDRALMDTFIEAGADPCAQNAVARALRRKGRPLLGFVKSYQNRFPGLFRQASIALHGFLDDDDEKGVSLMLWLGADPYLEVPDSPYLEDQDVSSYETSIEAALRRGNESIIQKMLRAPIPPSQVDTIMRATAYYAEPRLVQRLLEMGANPNATHEDLHILRHMVYGITPSYERSNQARRDSSVLESICLLAKAGAKFFLEPRDLNYMRRSLLHGESSTISKLFEIFEKHAVMTVDQLHELKRTGAMQRLLAGYSRPRRNPFSYVGNPNSDTSLSHHISTPKRSYWKRHWSQR